MKVNLVVTAAGPNQGRAIPVPGAKFLIGRDGQVVGRFKSGVKPESEELTKAIETELAKK